ncbi:MAG: DUF4091 domain-containing protein [Ruminococcaceae bacterium]|nr:DUF4091 domain-containing protein [Oscillospiraceae bacterium]
MKKTTISPTMRFLSLILMIAMLVCAVAACTTGISPAGTDAPTSGESIPATEAATKGDDSATEFPTDNFTEIPTEDAFGTQGGETESETQGPPVDNSKRENIPTDASVLTFYNYKRNKSLFTGANQCAYEIVMDETYGSVLKLTAAKGASDPFISFNYGNYMKNCKLDPISADEYKYMVYTIRVENVACESFEMFYCAGTVAGPTPGYQMTASFDSTNTGWQKMVFDLSGAPFAGELHAMRWDFLTAASGTGEESVYIYSIQFFKTEEEAMGDLDIDMTRPGEGSDLTEAPVDGVNYDKLNAPDEDASVSMWFDHMSQKVYQNDTTSSGKHTYVISMAGNSIENCQVFLAPETDRSFNVTLSEFTDGKSHTLRSEIYREHYVNVNGNMIPDALPPIQGAVDVKGGNSQGFAIKVWAEMNQPAGLYTATLDIKDASTGKHIKTAKVYVNVWDFSLSEETALKTAINMSSWPVLVKYQNAGMTEISGEEIYKIYFDFMLENRMSCYTLPYSLGDPRLEPYLDNPRLTSFVINKTTQSEPGAYEYLKDHPRWLEKGYFYYVDEPTGMDKLNQLKEAGERLEQTFPAYKQVSPFFTNVQINESTDQIEFMKPYVNIWCTKPFAFTPRDKYMVSGTQYMTTRAQDEKFGTFADRMKALQAEGHELWLYVCWEPAQPYANWLALGDGTEPIITIWQCALTNATGMLYWDAAYWTDDPYNDLTPLVGATSHGDGVLIYPGSTYGIYEPVSSHRFENIRLGIQDYQLLSMLEEGQGEAAADEMIAMVTTDVITYTNDDDYLHAVRVLLGEKVRDMLKK